jgi:hypothetical protein
LNIGTRWQHTENKRYNPANFYAATKEAFKNILIYYEKQGIKHKTIEINDTYGPGDTRKKVLDLLINACKNSEEIELTKGEQILDLSFVNDICRYVVKNIKSVGFFDNGTISLSGTIIKLRDLGLLIEEKSGKKNILKWGRKAYRENEIMTPPIYYRRINLNSESLENYLNAVLYPQNEV